MARTKSKVQAQDSFPMPEKAKARFEELLTSGREKHLEMLKAQREYLEKARIFKEADTQYTNFVRGIAFGVGIEDPEQYRIVDFAFEPIPEEDKESEVEDSQ